MSHRNWSIAGAVLLAGLMAIPSGPARSETSADFLRQAFDKGSAAPRSQTEITYKLGDFTFRYIVTRVQPDRTRATTITDSGRTQEVITIGDRMFTKAGSGGWSEGAAPRDTGAAHALPIDHRRLFADLKEQPRQNIGGREQRVFSGPSRWSSKGQLYEGNMVQHIDARDTLPTRFVFEGRCGPKTCSMIQTTRYAGTGLTVEAPAALATRNAIDLHVVQQDGKIAMHRHANALSALNRPRPPLLSTAAVAPRYKAIVAVVGLPVVYALAQNGDLYWIQHDGAWDGAPDWSQARQVATGWNAFDKIIAGEDGVLYGRYPNGTLRWHRHLGYIGGSDDWAQPRDVGQGWNGYVEIVAGSSGVLYGIKPNGDLMWHRHLGHLDGSPDAWAPSAQRVGTAWHTFKAVLSPGRGVIYAITGSGELIWYRHHAHATGEYRWADNSSLGSGWRDFRHVFAIAINQTD